MDAFDAKVGEVAGVADKELVHGKDAIDLLTVVLRQCGVSKRDAPKLVWTSYDRQLAANSPNLMTVVKFVSSPTAA